MPRPWPSSGGVTSWARSPAGLAVSLGSVGRAGRAAMALAERLPAVLKGDDQPRDNAERLAFAQMCYDTRRYAAAARLRGEALEADPRLGDDRQAQHRYNAACAAALAAAGRGIDDPPPDDAAKLKLREQARVWLQAELAAWSKLQEAQPQARPVIVQTLRHWQVDSDLDGLRDKGALAKRPAEERTACERLWADVAALLRRADAQGQQLDRAGKLAQEGLVLLEQKKYPEAEPLLRECLAIREEAQPDAWTTFNTRSLLGGASWARSGMPRRSRCCLPATGG